MVFLYFMVRNLITRLKNTGLHWKETGLHCSESVQFMGKVYRIQSENKKSRAGNFLLGKKYIDGNTTTGNSNVLKECLMQCLN